MILFACLHASAMFGKNEPRGVRDEARPFALEDHSGVNK